MNSNDGQFVYGICLWTVSDAATVKSLHLMPASGTPQMLHISSRSFSPYFLQRNALYLGSANHISRDKTNNFGLRNERMPSLSPRFCDDGLKLSFNG